MQRGAARGTPDRLRPRRHQVTLAASALDSQREGCARSPSCSTRATAGPPTFGVYIFRGGQSLSIYLQAHSRFGQSRHAHDTCGDGGNSSIPHTRDIWIDLNMGVPSELRKLNILPVQRERLSVGIIRNRTTQCQYVKLTVMVRPLLECRNTK